MNQYTEDALGAYTIGGLDWEFGRYEETGAYYIKCLDYPAVRKLIYATKSEAHEIANDFINEFLYNNK